MAHPDARPGREEEVATRPRSTTRPPRMHHVLLHNDDFTTQEFVVDVLVRYFHRTPTDAVRIMLEVHHVGRGVAGTYPLDVAETLAEQVTAAARAEGFPLLLTVEPE